MSQRRLLFVVLLLVCSASAQEANLWSKPLDNVAHLQSYRLQAKSVGLRGLPEAGEGKGDFLLARLTQVAYQGPARMRQEEQSFSDLKLTKRYAKALVLYDGNDRYLYFHSSERTQKIREDMRPWVEAGQPFQGSYPNWGGCFLEKQDYRGMVNAFAELPGWKAGASVPVNGLLCQTYENDISEGDLACRYRVYLDSDGWLRGLDTYYPEENPSTPITVYRIRYLNIEVNPTLSPSLFQVTDPKSYQLW